MGTHLSRRHFVKSAGLLAGACGLAPVCSCVSHPGRGAVSPRPPNVVLIITDDQGYGDLGCHGNDRIATPNLDQLAGQSAQLTRFFVCPVCSPTRASLLTGRYHFRTGAIDTYLGRSLMHPDELTLAEMLRSAGYRTGIFGKWHLGDNYPLRPQEQGFEEVLVHRGGGMVQPGDPPGSRYMDPILQHNGRQEVFRGYCSDVFADAAIRFIRGHRSDPFFVYLAFNAPHTPLQVPEAWVQPYRTMGLEDTTARIYAMVQNIDLAVGRLLAVLDELSLAANTVVVFLSDNGPQQKRYNAGMRGLKGSVYSGGIRVPCFIRYPGYIGPGPVDQMAGHIDIVPTLLELCGLPVEGRMLLDGISLAPLLQGRSARLPERSLFIQWHRGDRPVPFQNAAVITRRYKLVNGRELYDLEDDPAEENDLAAEHPTVVAQLRGQYERWFADVTAAARYLPPRIVLGSPNENPSMLTRQDWRGERAGWARDSLGHWEVELVRRGRYDIAVHFLAAGRPARVRLSFREVTVDLPVAGDQTSCIFRHAELPAGAGNLMVTIAADGASYGPDYVYVDLTE